MSVAPWGELMRQPEADRGWATVTLALATLVLSAMPVGAADASTTDRWNFDLSVYGWLPTIEGKLNYDIPGSGDTLEVDLGTIINDLQLTGMLAFGARRNRWSAFADVIYLDLADGEDSSVPLSIGSGLMLDVGAQLEVKTWVTTIAGGYDFVQTERAELGVLFGLRYFSMDTDLSIQVTGPLPPQLPTDQYAQGVNLWDGIVGLKGHYGRKWYVPYYLDLGTGSSEFTWQAMTGFGYRWHWGSVFLVYRYLSYDEGDEKFVRDLSIAGPALGVSIRL
jgi:hypothetical protein